jgi:hypothetical protein
MTPKQAAYISVTVDGPYKPDTYRYWWLTKFSISSIITH